MIHWLSDYNYDFALASIPVQLVLLTFYCFRRNLPIRQIRNFTAVMISNLVMTVSDIVSCEMNEIWNDFPLWLMFAVNMLYFLSFIIRGWALFAYAAEACHSFKSNNKWFFIITHIPVCIALALTLSTPWTAAIFTITPADGYFNCALYKTIYVSTYFYIGASFLCIFMSRKQLANRVRMGLIISNTLLLLGIIFRKLFIQTLVTSYFSIIVIMVLYLTAENPDLFYDRRVKIFNKYAFDSISSEFIRRNIPFHCVIASAQNFDAIKNLYGVERTTQRLQLIGKRMRVAFPDDYVFYMGAGNFILMNYTNLSDESEEAAKAWNARFEDLLRNDEDAVVIHFSVLLLPYRLIKESIVEIYELIHFASVMSTPENRQSNSLISDGMLASLARQKKIEFAVKTALQNRSIEVYFQPIYSTQENKVVGAEALARLHNDELGYIPPLEFISIAEKNGDIMELGRQIFGRVCDFIARERVLEHGISFININLSPAQCLDENLASAFSAIAAGHGVPMTMFDFEITETSLDDHQPILNQITSLQQCGAELSLDDFGTGTSNITRLMKLPIHVVKLDMSVVHSYFSGESSILPDLIRMFRNSDMEIVAEGVETLEMQTQLAKMGCDYEQGYYFSKPIPPNAFLDYLHAQA